MVRKLILAITALLLLTGCPEEGTIRINKEVNLWVYNQMKEHYLWSSEMPERESLNFNRHPEDFFSNLKYKFREDVNISDPYSKIYYTGDPEFYPVHDEDVEYGNATRTYNFGVEFRKTQGALNFGQVIYVSPGSPAYRAGLKRGDCFQYINGIYIGDYPSGDQFDAYLEGLNSATIDLIYPEEKTVTLSKEYYTDNPVHFDTIYNFSPVTGYFVYNHFTDGNNEAFYNSLRGVFSRFAEAGVENIIADFRYNGGGELNAARKMCSLLAPPSALGGPYLYKEYNASYENPAKFTEEKLYPASQVNGCNCGDITLYIIATKDTASASELVIHCLRPLYEENGLKFVHVGQNTLGKNVGGRTFSNNRYEWMLDPITFRVHDIHRKSGYESGLVPDISIPEVDNTNIVQTDSGEYIIPIADFGDATNDRLLTAIMNDIYGYGGWPAGAKSRALHAPLTSPEGISCSTTIRPRPLVEQ